MIFLFTKPYLFKIKIKINFEDIVMRPPTQRAPRARVTREVYFTEIDSVPRRGTDEAERYIG